MLKSLSMQLGCGNDCFGSSKKSEIAASFSLLELSDSLIAIGTMRILVIASFSVFKIVGMSNKPKRTLKTTPIEIDFKEFLFENFDVRIGISSMW